MVKKRTFPKRHALAALMVTMGLAMLGVASVSAAQSGSLTVVPTVGSGGETLLGDMTFSAGPYGECSREKAKIARLRQQIENKQARIAELQAELDGAGPRKRERLRERIADLREDIAELRDEIEEAREELEECREEAQDERDEDRDESDPDRDESDPDRDESDRDTEG